MLGHCEIKIALGGVQGHLECIKGLEGDVQNRRSVHFGKVTYEEVAGMLQGLCKCLEVEGLGFLCLSDQAPSFILLVLPCVHLHFK